MLRTSKHGAYWLIRRRRIGAAHVQVCTFVRSSRHSVCRQWWKKKLLKHFLPLGAPHSLHLHCNVWHKMPQDWSEHMRSRAHVMQDSSSPSSLASLGPGPAPQSPHGRCARREPVQADVSHDGASCQPHTSFELLQVQGYRAIPTFHLWTTFVISGLTLDTPEAVEALKAPKGLIFGLLSILGITPLLGFGIPILPVDYYVDFQVGLMNFCAVPSTLSSGITLVRSVRALPCSRNPAACWKTAV
jgi:hypothetical protein